MNPSAGRADRRAVSMFRRHDWTTWAIVGLIAVVALSPLWVWGLVSLLGGTY